MGEESIDKISFVLYSQYFHANNQFYNVHKIYHNVTFKSGPNVTLLGLSMVESFFKDRLHEMNKSFFFLASEFKK